MNLIPPDQLVYTDDEEANRLIAHDPMALLIGFVLDQQVPVMKAFSGPLELKRRIGSIDARHITEMDAGDLDAAFRTPPALHRFPGNMAKQTAELAAAIVKTYDGDAGAIWSGVSDAAELERRLLELPGIGAMKAGTIIAILAKRYDFHPSGWEQRIPDYPTLADVDSADSLAEYRAGKAARKAEARAKAG
jgi:uncharacterized HhH-GPD family protein